MCARHDFSRKNGIYRKNPKSGKTYNPDFLENVKHTGYVENALFKAFKLLNIISMIRQYFHMLAIAHICSGPQK